MKKPIATAAVLALLTAPAFAEGDIDAGKKAFGKCKSCHQIVSDTGETIAKGGKVGPNLWGLAGRAAGTAESYRYGKHLVAAGESGLVWDEESFVTYVQDPRGFLRAHLDDSKAKSKMNFKLKKGGEDIYAYLAQYGAPVVTEAATDDAATTEETGN